MTSEPSPPHERTENFIHAMAASASGVTVVTTAGKAGRFGLTVSAVCSVSADPPLLLACLNRKSPSVAAIATNGYFAVNILGAHAREVADVFSGRIKVGSAYDFNRHDWRQGLHGLPILADAAAHFECMVDQAVDAGTHRIFIGKVLSAIRNEGAPLVYSRRKFGHITPHS